MAAEIIGGPIYVGLDQDENGARMYRVTHRVLCTDTGSSSSIGDGPFTVRSAAGLPVIGAPWNFGNDFDAWAFCTPKTSIRPDPQHKIPAGDGYEKATFYLVDNFFTTLPNKRCQDSIFEDPLLEPQKVAGGFIRKQIEAMFNYDGTIIKTSSHELIRGAQVEFDDADNYVHIEQNVPDLELPLVSSMRKTVNSTAQWGMGTRTIRLAGFNWELRFYGTCDYYFTRMFDFEVRDEGWDRTLLDEGTKVLHGRWVCSAGRHVWEVTPFKGDNCTAAGITPDKDNPAHFTRYKDPNGENAVAILDGQGQPFDGTESGTGTGVGGEPGTILVQFYSPVDYFSLGIPVDLATPAPYGG